jgi:hypothetical protein
MLQHSGRYRRCVFCKQKRFRFTKISVRFQNEYNKVETELRVVQFWTEIKLVITNRTPASRSCDFVIARLISVQIALHSVQLPSLIARLARVIIYLLYAWQNPFFKIQLHFVKTFNSFVIGRLLRSDIVYFHFPCLGTEIFLRELSN